MGLDMYLEKDIYVGANFKHREVKGIIQLEAGGKPLNINLEKVTSITEQVAYWRKANAIHAWFVENVQDGVDECQRTYVSREDLEELLDVVTRVLDSVQKVPGPVRTSTSFEKSESGEIITTENYKNGIVIDDPSVAEMLLPTQSGFFFGGTAYDEWYVNDLEYTKRVLEEELKDETAGGFLAPVSYYYQSSW